MCEHVTIITIIETIITLFRQVFYYRIPSHSMAPNHVKKTVPRHICENMLVFLSQVLLAVLERRRQGFIQSTADEI